MFNTQIDPTKKNRLFTAARTGNFSLLATEVDEETINICDDKTGNSLIQTAAAAGHVDIVSFLLANDAIIETSRFSTQLSVLHLWLIASNNSNNEHIIVLDELFNLHINAGFSLFSDPTIGEFANFTLLWLLASKKYYAKFSILLNHHLQNNSDVILLQPTNTDKKSNVDIQEYATLSKNKSIFDFLFDGGQWDILQKIIVDSRIFNANARYHHDTKPEPRYSYLYLLALQGSWNIIKLLVDLDYELDFDYKPKNIVLSVFDVIAQSNETYDLCEKILTKYKINYYGTNLKAESIIIDGKINEVLPELEKTPLEQAVTYGLYFWVKYLLAHGAKERPISDSIPLEYIAVEHEQYEILRYLHNNYRKCFETPEPQNCTFTNISLAWLLVRVNKLDLFHEFYDGNFSHVDFQGAPENDSYEGKNTPSLLFHYLLFLNPDDSKQLANFINICPLLDFNIVFKNVAFTRKIISKDNSVTDPNNQKQSDNADVTPLWMLAAQKKLQCISKIIDLNISLNFNFSPISGKYQDISVAWIITDLSKNDELMRKILSLPEKVDFSKQGVIGNSKKLSILEYFVRKKWLHLIIDHPLYQDILPDFFDIAIYYGDIDAITKLKQKGIQPKLQLNNVRENFKSQFVNTVKNDHNDSLHVKFFTEKSNTGDVVKALKKQTKKLPANREDIYGKTLIFYCMLFNDARYIKHLLSGRNPTIITSELLEIAYQFSPLHHQKLYEARGRQVDCFRKAIFDANEDKIYKASVDIRQLSNLLLNHLQYFSPDFLLDSFIAPSKSTVISTLNDATPIVFALSTYATSSVEMSHLHLLQTISAVINNMCRNSDKLPLETRIHLRATLINIYSRIYLADFLPDAQKPLTCKITKSIITHIHTIISEIENNIKNFSLSFFLKDYSSLLNFIRSFSYTVELLNELIPLFLNIKITIQRHLHDLEQENSQGLENNCLNFLSDKEFHGLLLLYLKSLERIFSFYYVFKDDLTKIPNNEIYLSTLFKFYKDIFVFIDLIQECHFDAPMNLCASITQTQTSIYNAFLLMYPNLKAKLQQPFENAIVTATPNSAVIEELSQTENETDKEKESEPVRSSIESDGYLQRNLAKRRAIAERHRQRKQHDYEMNASSTRTSSFTIFGNTDHKFQEPTEINEQPSKKYER